MSELSRRRFLGLGRRGESEQLSKEDSPRASTGVGAAPLPSVISWLKDIDQEPALPPRHASAPLLRPPGAVAAVEFQKLCTSCGDCAMACPHHSILPAPLIFRDQAGTPMINPSVQPCWLCEDLPCIQACETGALADSSAGMGRAHIQTHDCLQALGSDCRVCIEQCPVDGAISLQEGRIAVSKLCVGCGVCHYVCPAPQNAIAILPRPAARPR